MHNGKQVQGVCSSYLALLLELGSLAVGGLLRSLLLLQNRLGDGDVVLGGDAAAVSNCSLVTVALCAE